MSGIAEKQMVCSAGVWTEVFIHQTSIYWPKNCGASGSQFACSVHFGSCQGCVHINNVHLLVDISVRNTHVQGDLSYYDLLDGNVKAFQSFIVLRIYEIGTKITSKTHYIQIQCRLSPNSHIFLSIHAHTLTCNQVRLRSRQ